MCRAEAGEQKAQRQSSPLGGYQGCPAPSSAGLCFRFHHSLSINKVYCAVLIIKGARPSVPQVKKGSL